MRILGSLSKRSLPARAVAVVSAVALGVGAAGGAAYALTAGSPQPPGAASGSGSAAQAAVTPTALGQSSSPTATVTAARRRSGIYRFLRGAVHAEVEVPAAGGGFRTIDIDKGTVSALSSTSITIAPADGRSPITATITSSTHEPKRVTLSQGEKVFLVSSDGKALAIRPVRPASP